ncbi:murein biosynthesis integral membrane protein MurJ [Helicobacter bilis]|uniref:murein biosynthesis integral membrane protein MurJ n=1 Tax=Helicobacter bilis TaxID=37372 RepID=UPI0026EA8AED|nr:murein biosynthesis integral membrane protein MurJ [Helicobacter bilis]MCI7410389.1 murein biosynthesis integral membrane protein MurJ [Helicobacter bilis]MDD7296972.1 murein biosynthesis integral membrane protein MurJ [Helicobacter bilis]MDY4400033.1 murein biosynthesis integral membrane protein MurJ [Helicobacter bilis]
MLEKHSSENIKTIDNNKQLNIKQNRLKRFFLTNASGILCSRVFGFLRDAIQAAVLGTSIYSDIFFIAFKFPNMFRRVVSEGAFVQSFLPFFLSAKRKGAFSVSIFWIFLFFILILSILVMWFAPFITKILALGYDEERINLAMPLVRIHFWYLILIFIVTYLSTLLQYKNIFWVNAYNTALLNIAMIVAMLPYQFQMSLTEKELFEAVYILSYAVLIGGVCQILIHFYPLYRAGLWKLQYIGMLSLKKWYRDSNMTISFRGIRFGGKDSITCHVERSEISHIESNSALNTANNLDSKQNLESKKSIDKNSAEVSLSDFVGCADIATRSYLKGNDAVSISNSRKITKETTQDSRFYTKAKHNILRLFADIKAFFKAFFPAMLGASTAQIIAIIDSSLITLLPNSDGGVSTLNFANRIFQLPLAIFAIAISSALFPTIAKAIERKDEKIALQNLKTAFWFLLITLSICTLGGIMLSNEIVWLLFERKNFVREDTLQVAWAFIGYMAGLLAFGLTRIFSLWLYAKKQQAKAAKYSVIALAVGTLLSGIFIFFMRYFSITDGILWELRYFIVALAGSIGGVVLFVFNIKAFGIHNFLAIISHKKYAFYLLLALGVTFSILQIFKQFFHIT